MANYVLTVYEKSGKLLLDETIEAKDDIEAKELGMQRLYEEGYTEHTYRCVAPNARLILFKS